MVCCISQTDKGFTNGIEYKIGAVLKIFINFAVCVGFCGWRTRVRGARTRSISNPAKPNRNG